MLDAQTGTGDSAPAIGTQALGRIKATLEEVYREGRWLTLDVGGKATTREFTKAVIRAMA
jgi:isocitrate/isopropylmalate dehydrogenase